MVMTILLTTNYSSESLGGWNVFHIYHHIGAPICPASTLVGLQEAVEALRVSDIISIVC